MDQIYREDYIHSSAGGTGKILLAPSITSWTIVATAGIAIAAVTCLIIFASYTKRVVASGVLLPEGGLIYVVATKPGVVAERFVNEGQEVKKGERLFSITDERMYVNDEKLVQARHEITTALEMRKSAILRAESANSLLADTVLKAARSRLEMLKQQRFFTTAQIASQANLVTSANASLARYTQLASSGFIAPAALVDKADAVSVQRAQSMALMRQAEEINVSIAAVDDEIKQIPIRKALAAATTQRELSALAQEGSELTARDRNFVVAPVDGVIAAVTGRVGQAAGVAPLATLLPKGSSLVANLFLPSRSVGFLKVGAMVHLRYQAYPYQKFGQHSGVVTEIGANPLYKSEISTASPFVTDEGAYRILVRPAKQTIDAYGEPVELKSGLSVEAFIDLDRRTLKEWIFEPLYGVRQRLQ